MIFHVQLVLGSLLLGVANHVEPLTPPPPPRAQTPLHPSRWVSLMTTRSHAHALACPRVRMPTQTHIQDDIHRECCECNAV